MTSTVPSQLESALGRTPFDRLSERGQQSLRERGQICRFAEGQTLSSAEVIGDRVLLLNNQGRLHADERVSLPPRDQDLKLQPEFNRYVRALSQSFHALEVTA